MRIEVSGINIDHGANGSARGRVQFLESDRWNDQKGAALKRLVVIDGKFLAKLTLALLLTALASCGSKGDTEPHGDTADAYAIVVRWFVDNYASIDADPDVKQVVFVEALGEGVGIGLETQVAFVAASDSFADVRFIDDRSQAMDGDNVRDDVILLAIGPAITDGAMAIIECDQVLSEGNVLSWTFNLVYRAELWTLTSAPSPRE